MTEIGVVVADAWQGQGVGSALVRALISGAQSRGVTSLSMDVLPENHQVLDMITAHWGAVRTHRDADCVTLRVALPPAMKASSIMVRARGPGSGRYLQTATGVPGA